MNKFVSGRGNSTQRYTHGGRTTSFPRRQGYIDDRLGSGYEDDVPAMLTAGEYVIKRSSVTKYGETFLNRLNQGLVSDNVRYMNQGGRVNNNGRNDMPHMSRTRQQTRRRGRRRTRNGEMGANAYTSRRRRTPARRTSNPRRTSQMSMPNTTTRRRRTPGYNTGGRVQRRRTANGRVQNFYHGGMAHSNGNGGAMMTSTMSTNNTNAGVRFTGANNGRYTTSDLLKRRLPNGKYKYYDCKGSLYFTPECAEVATQQLVDEKTGKHGPSLF